MLDLHESDQSIIAQPILELVRKSLALRRQYLTYLDAVHDQTNSSNQFLTALATKFESALQTLKITCRSKSTVPVDQVYPQFIQLSKFWGEWMDELFLLVFRRGIVDALKTHLRNTIEIPNEITRAAESFRADIDSRYLAGSLSLNKTMRLYIRLRLQ